MSDITPTSSERLVEALRQRERRLETDLARIAARLEEVRDVIAQLTSRPRGRPRIMRGVRGDEPLPPPAGLPGPSGDLEGPEAA